MDIMLEISVFRAARVCLSNAYFELLEVSGGFLTLFDKNRSVHRLRNERYTLYDSLIM